MRYTEARLARMAEELLADIDKDTVDFVDNFDGSLQEPTVLPARLPNLLLNGATGIAVGMATNIPPHNLGELANAIAYLIDDYDRLDDVTVDELMRFVPGPDFPTGGMIVGVRGHQAGLQHRQGPHRGPGPGPHRGAWRGGAPPHRHHRDPLPGQQDGADRAHRRAGPRGPPGRHLRPARRIRPRAA